MKVIEEKQYSIAAIGTCESCLKEDMMLTRVYHHYDGQCECHSPNHFEVWDICQDCNVPSKLGQEIEVDCRFKSFNELKNENRKNTNKN